MLEPAVGVDVAARLLGEGRPGEHRVGHLGQRRDQSCPGRRGTDPGPEPRASASVPQGSIASDVK